MTAVSVVSEVSDFPSYFPHGDAFAHRFLCSSVKKQEQEEALVK
jgi:hypothetical protein